MLPPGNATTSSSLLYVERINEKRHPAIGVARTSSCKCEPESLISWPRNETGMHNNSLRGTAVFANVIADLVWDLKSREMERVKETEASVQGVQNSKPKIFFLNKIDIIVEDLYLIF